MLRRWSIRSDWYVFVVVRGMLVRIYVPAISASLCSLFDTGALGLVLLIVFVVILGLREWYVDDDFEEFEYVVILEVV